MDNIQTELFEQCFELEDIISVEETGYKNMYDITVTGEHTFLLGNGIVSHNSAFGGLSPVFGRKECGYYILRGKPLNAYSAPQAKMTQNKELSELYRIIQNEMTFADKPDGKWYSIQTDDGEMIVNENDNVLLNGKWVPVTSMI